MGSIVHTERAPQAVGPYSQAVCTGGFVFTSGQIAINPSSGIISAASIETQTEQVCKNLAAVLEKAGSSLDRVVKTTCFLSNMDDFEAFNAVYSRFFTGMPARSCVEVSRLPKGAKVEIEAVGEI